EAAQRGVRVRLLLDDTSSIKMDRQLASLAGHPNISVRLYNPSARRILRSLSFLGDFARLNHRMHNKSLTVDNRLSVVGGRNVGNEYFSNDETLEFGDLDALLAGPVVDDISDQFDGYWNSPIVYTVESINPLAEPRAGLDYFVSLVNTQKQLLATHPYVRRLAKSPFLRHLADNKVNWFFGKAWVLADPPQKRLAAPDECMVTPLLAEFSRVKDELVIISPYFVPTEQGVTLLTELVSQGVEVTVITNSLAATDVLAVHSGYQKYRHRLLCAGVKLYEVKEKGRRRRRPWRGRSRSSLHAKSFLFDKARFFIGSFNFDPRSATLNTEMGGLIEQMQMAEALRAWLVSFLLHD
ncbi:MAG: phospholipase D family protein, partial [Plesiomonas shigelloides]